MNFIHTDFIPKIVFNLINKKINNETFNLASTNSVSIKNILKSYNIKKIQKVKEYKNKKQIYKIDVRKILKYTSLVKTEKSIKDYVINLNKKIN